MKKRFVLILLTILSVTHIGFSKTDDQYAYRPYPVILVHGFSSSPYGTVGLLTDKRDKDKDAGIEAEDLEISTRIKSDTTKGYHDRDHLGWKLMKAFDNNEQGPFLADYFADSTNKKLDTLQYDRLIPAEEENSYTGINHTFVEVYCSFYRYESNDANGVKYPKFGIVDKEPSKNHTDKYYYAPTEIYKGVEDYIYEGNWCDDQTDSDGDAIEDCNNDTVVVKNGANWGRKDYDISRGGQTQLLRIRVIQMLNEYYGDFKWVGDPSAKLKVVAHSNGGLVTTSLLKTDDDYFNKGRNLVDSVASESNVIDGFGFRLRDHIDQVITVDTPFDGSPFASVDKNALS